MSEFRRYHFDGHAICRKCGLDPIVFCTVCGCCLSGEICCSFSGLRTPEALDAHEASALAELENERIDIEADKINAAMNRMKEQS